VHDVLELGMSGHAVSLIGLVRDGVAEGAGL
jgi:hypothetical protein